MIKITHFKGREILDSRGFPTVEAEVRLSNGFTGRASVPAGASRGKNEAVELVDNEADRYIGQGKKQAVHYIEGELFELVRDSDPLNQLEFDRMLCAADGQLNKSRLGANTLLAVSLATAKAAAKSQNLSLYEYIAKLHGREIDGEYLLPTPMMNLLNGGVHADNGLDVQEFLVIPWGASSFHESLRWGVEIFQALKNILKQKNLSTTVGDEGGFAPKIQSTTQALDLLMDAVIQSRYPLGHGVSFGLDCAASQWKGTDGRYHLKYEGKLLNNKELLEHFSQLCQHYPLLSIEDGFSETDWEGFQLQTQQWGNRLQIVGDDLFVTHPNLLAQGIQCGAANAILIKLNQIGTLSETLTTIRMAQLAGYNVIISHRSGETEDTSLVDLAVGTGAGQIKTGSLSRGERIAKYNRLLRIEEELGARARFASLEPFQKFFRPSSHPFKQ